MIEQFDMGDSVACDWCSKDYTNSNATGGLLFQSKATCPDCVARIEASAAKYGEEQFIRDRCPVGMSFKEWVLKLRGGNNMVTFYNQGECP